MEGVLERAPATVVAGVAVAAVIVAAVARAALSRWWRRLAARRRLRRARAGELDAEALLAGRGYLVVERQPRRALGLLVDGAPLSVELRADLIVERRGRRFVAEVKTGDRAPRLETRATRRQLLEYRVAYADVDGVLLVEPEAREIHEVTFVPQPFRAERARSLARAALVAGAAGFLAGAAATWLVLGR